MTNSLAHLMVWKDQSEITNIPDSYRTVTVYRNFYWLVNDKGQVAFFKGRSPQCNPDKRICERMMRDPYVAIVQIPVAFGPHECDYYG